MYVMKVDGKAFYAPTLPQHEYQVLTPNLKHEINTSGELTFVLPPGHVLRDSIHKLKSVVTVEQNGVEVFRGRVSEESVDIYNQKECYCEGDLSFLRDSMQRPYTYDGTAKAYFQQLIDSHNEQVDEGKRFTVGLLTALSDDDKVVTESVDYKDTLSEIRYILVSEFDGYLRTRYENGIRYIDYIDEYDEVCSQKIEFGVNLLDLDNQINANDICTVLIPLGKQDNNNRAVTIASVNNGSDCIESAEGIARYGRIVKTYSWPDVESPAELMKKGQEKLNEMAAVETLTLTAVDLHLLNVDVDRIRVGSKVHLLSKPHGLDKEEICTAIDIDLENPEKSTYTFGKPEETLSSGMSANSRAISDGKSESKLYHNHTLQYYDEVNNALNTVMLDMNAVEASLTLKVSRDDVVSAINMSPESVKISASRIELDGETIVSKLSGLSIDVSHIDTYSIYANEGDFGMLYVAGDIAGWQSTEVVTAVGGRGVTGEYKTIQYLNWNGEKASTSVMTGFTQAAFSTTKETLNYLGSATT